jgi:hypothetical protein
MTSPLVPDARTTVDPRGPRFGASITVVVLAAALVTAGSPVGLVLIAWQTLVFALGAFVGLYAQPYGVIFRKLICPRLTPPTDSRSWPSPWWRPSPAHRRSRSGRLDSRWRQHS